MAIHQKIKSIRESKKIKQQTMADFLEISQPAYAKLENGQTKINCEDLIKIATYTETPIQDFFTGEVSICNIQQNNQEPVINNNLRGVDSTTQKNLYEKLIEAKDEIIFSKNELIKAKDELLKKYQNLQ
jgi:transcriptional regulator with XRE-family HTH domain